jgi:hypothetical protein
MCKATLNGVSLSKLCGARPKPQGRLQTDNLLACLSAAGLEKQILSSKYIAINFPAALIFAISNAFHVFKRQG